MKFQLAQAAILRASSHYREQTRAARTQTSRHKFRKFRLFFHLDHVWHRFDHAFGKERLGVRIHGVKLGF